MEAHSAAEVSVWIRINSQFEFFARNFTPFVAMYIMTPLAYSAYLY